MDHFIGFDALLRITLGRDTILKLYGPPGLIANVQGKLQGYTWNLVHGYPLVITVKEFHPRSIHTASFHATDGYTRREAPDQMPIHREPDGCFYILEDPMFTVQAVTLNHRIPSFAYALQEQFHVNINKERLHEAGLPVGSWLKEVKQYLWQGKPDDFRFQATLYHEHHKEERELVLGDVRGRQPRTETRLCRGCSIR
jgi:ribonuclease Z